MELEPQIAKKIVKNLKDIINFEINLFDTTGTIIASTDECRVGTSHLGALKAAKSKKILIIEYDNQFEGAKKGINLPVLFNDEVAVIIGITGEKEEVEPFGNIIKKMTEILIRENWVQITNFNQQMNYNNLISMLLAEARDESLTAYLASILDIDLKMNRCVVYGYFKTNDFQRNSNYDDLTHLVERRLTHYEKSFYTVSNQTITILMESIDQSVLNYLLEALANDIFERYRIPFVFGVGSIVEDYKYLITSFEEAKIASFWAKNDSSCTVKNFSDLNVEFILSSINTEYIQRFIDHVFRNLKPLEIESFSKLLEVYTNHNGSISRGADELFIHKNTFQNKLNRLYELTGLNPRNMKDYVTLSIAFQLRTLMADTSSEIHALTKKDRSPEKE